MSKNSTRTWLVLIHVFFLTAISNDLFSQGKPEIQTITGKLVRVTPKLADLDKSSMYGEPFVITRDSNGIILNNSGEFARNKRRVKKLLEEKLRNASKGFTTEAIQNPNTIFPNTPGTSLGTNFDGQTSPGVSPTDNNMAAGPNHVIQMVNNSAGSQFTIWNKSGAVVQSPTIFSSLTGFPGLGDPVVVFDQLANRWLMVEFGPSFPMHNLNMAVSVTADPTGPWRIYQYQDFSFAIDYHKFSVWHNGYYATSNDFSNDGSAYLGSSIYAMDRAGMLSGAPTVTMIRIRQNDAGNNYYNMGTIGLEGMTPSAQGGLFAFPVAPSTLNLFEFAPDFAVPANSVVGPLIPITIANYSSPPDDVPQQGSSTRVETLGERFMFKLNYRNNSGTESIVITHTVDNSGLAAVRWYELRRVSGNWVLYQQGTVTGSDGNSRFLGGISMDGCGNIALMYNVSGTTSFPSIRYTGRIATDPPGQMTLPEAVIINGTTAHNNNSRWGDYNTTVQDYSTNGLPNNGSFWSTAQYGNQSTRIANFTLTGGCAPAPNITINGFTLVAESCVPANGVIDPGETVTVSVCLKNIGNAPAVNVVGTLQTSGGVISTGGPAAYGAIPVNSTVCRNFTFNNNSATCGAIITASLQVQDGVSNLGTVLYPVTLGTVTTLLSENFDGLAVPAIPPGWTATNAAGTAPLWVTSNSGTPAPPAASNPNAAFINDPGSVSDKILQTPAFTPAFGAMVNFSHNYSLESNFDGGVLEISINGGAFQDIIAAGGSFISGAYTDAMFTFSSNPLAGRQAWTGSSGGTFINVSVKLPSASFGKSTSLRFRMGSDASVSDAGWRIDNFQITQPACCGAPCTITCPPDITVNSDPNQCGANVTLPASTISGLCGPVSYSPASGSFFPVGSTTVTASTASGQSCTFTVTVVDATPPSLTCPAAITTNNTPGLCEAVVTYPLPLATDNCVSLTSVSDFATPWTSTGQRGIFFDVTNVGTAPLLINRFRPAIAGSNGGMVTDQFSVYVTSSAQSWSGKEADPSAWVLNTNANISFPGGANPLQSVINLTSPIILAPGQSKGIYITGTSGFGGGPNAYLSTAAGYTGPQSFQDANLKITGGIGAAGLFSTFFGTGVPDNFRLYYGSADYSFNLPVTQIAGLPSGSVFPAGVTVNTFRATDASGNQGTCSFTVTVNDVENPSFTTCPAPVVINTDPGQCYATYTPEHPVFTDNCAVTKLTWVMTGATTGSSPATGINYVPSTQFGLIGTTGQGINTITYTATDAAGNTKTCVQIITVKDASIPVISVPPVTKFVCVGSDAVFSVTANAGTGNPLTYQWQQWNGSAWGNITGATASTFTVPAVTFAQNTNTYRVVLTGRCSEVVSATVSLFINPLPTVSLVTSIPPSLVPSQSLNITANVSPAGGSFVWRKNGNIISGVTGASLTGLTVDDIGTYRVTYTDINGCVNTSADIVVSGQASDKLWVYPNPNSGQFQVRFYNAPGETVTVRVFDAKGAKVYQKAVVTGLAYTQIEVDLRPVMTAGFYVVELINSSGKRIGAKKLDIRH